MEAVRKMVSQSIMELVDLRRKEARKDEPDAKFVGKCQAVEGVLKLCLRTIDGKIQIGLPPALLGEAKRDPVTAKVVRSPHEVRSDMFKTQDEEELKELKAEADDMVSSMPVEPEFEEESAEDAPW